MSRALAPALQDHQARPPDRPRPWTIRGQLAVAVFGGPVALTVIAYLNSGRLGMPRRERRKLLGAGLLLCIASPFAIALPGVGLALVGGGSWWLLSEMQKTWDRTWMVFGPFEDSHGSLLGPGLLAVLGLGWLPLALVLVAVL